MKLVRKLHFYLGVLFAPSLIFFAISGALQLYELHEGDDGAEPATWIVKLAEVHKIQSLADPPPRPPRPPEATRGAEPPRAGEAPPTAAPRPPRRPIPRSAPLKVFFLLMSLGLITSSVLGVVMAFQYRRDRRVIVGLLAAGLALPVLFLLLV